MNTTFLLMAEYGTTDIPLEVVAAKYLGMAARAAHAKAFKGELPFPAYRPGSQKSPWLVRITDLAAWLDAEREKARKALMARGIQVG